jgi:hypothetical protein
MVRAPTDFDDTAGDVQPKLILTPGVAPGRRPSIPIAKSGLRPAEPSLAWCARLPRRRRRVVVSNRGVLPRWKTVEARHHLFERDFTRVSRIR